MNNNTHVIIHALKCAAMVTFLSRKLNTDRRLKKQALGIAPC